MMPNLVIGALSIHLREAEAKASTAEAVVLRLRIEYHKLCNSG